MTIIGLRPNERDLQNLTAILMHLRPLMGSFVTKSECLRWALERAAEEARHGS